MAVNTQVLANDTTHKQANSIFLQPQEKQNVWLSVNLCCFYSYSRMGHGPHAYFPPLPHARACCMGTAPTAFSTCGHYLYMRSTNPRPGKRGGRVGFMNLCPLWPIIGHSLIWEAEAKPCPCTALLTCSESNVPGKASGHPGKKIAGSRIHHQPLSSALYPLSL